MNIEIIPTILTRHFSTLQKKLDQVADLVNRVQIDIIDKKFANNKTITIEQISEVNTNLILDIQLMVNQPITYLNRCNMVGANRVYGHVEQMQDKEEFVETISDTGMQGGLGLDIHTPVSAIEKMLPYLDGVLLMSTEVGFSGQKFNPKVLEKIETLRKKNFTGDICIDGGLDTAEIKPCKEKGANHFAINSSLWKAKDIKTKLEELKGIM